MDLVEFRLKYEQRTSCFPPYPVPMVQDVMFKTKLECLVEIGILKCSTNYKHWSLTFDQPKSTFGRVRVLGNFRILNRQLISKPYTILKLQEIIV